MKKIINKLDVLGYAEFVSDLPAAPDSLKDCSSHCESSCTSCVSGCLNSCINNCSSTHKSA